MKTYITHNGKTYYRATEKEVAAPKLESVSFDVKDTSGRTIGAQAWLRTIEIVADDESLYSMDLDTQGPGTYYTFTPGATRNGDRFGAISPRRYFKTEEARAAAVAKYFVDARKRAAKAAA